jgi:hypothetical protein
MIEARSHTEREAQWRIYEAAQLRIASSLDIAMLRHAWRFTGLLEKPKEDADYPR